MCKNILDAIRAVVLFFKTTDQDFFHTEIFLLLSGSFHRIFLIWELMGFFLNRSLWDFSQREAAD